MKYMPASQTVISKRNIGRPFQFACVHLYSSKKSVSLSQMFL